MGLSETPVRVRGPLGDGFEISRTSVNSTPETIAVGMFVFNLTTFRPGPLGVAVGPGWGVATGVLEAELSPKSATRTRPHPEINRSRIVGRIHREASMRPKIFSPNLV